ncbi:hypothetical protein VTN49DRAFT_3089 [Thermomyces lanuginosus]|uniref:uncharacterized protein n=1 Tax=Thermomyces lanuginosus TaxID=5541 RepID=UPI003742D838
MAFRWPFNVVTLRLQSVESVNQDTKRFRFALPDPNAYPGLSLTSALLTVHRPAWSLFPVFRPYTPISNLAEPGYIEFLVKRYPNGRASGHLHRLQPGDKLTVMGPIRGYRWKTNEVHQINLIAGGVGITPMFQLIQGILNNAEEKTKIKLLFGANTDSELVLRDELNTFQKRFPDRFQVVYTVVHPAEGSPYRKGYITKELLEKELVMPKDEKWRVFVCGPPGMETSLFGTRGWFGLFGRRKGILEELGIPKNRTYKF